MMLRAIRRAVAAAPLFVSLVAVPGSAHAAPPDQATYITREEFARVERAEPVGDRTVKVVDVGHENFAVGIVHRGRTVKGRSSDRASLTLPPPTPCGRQTKEATEGGYPGGITHDAQAEGYYITSGGGTMFTGGYIADGAKYDLAELNGPTCLGTAYGVTERTVKPGDVVIVPAGVVHGWIEVPDHVDYISFRPSPGILSAGWVHPAIRERGK